MPKGLVRLRQKANRTFVTQVPLLAATRDAWRHTETTMHQSGNRKVDYVVW